MKRATLQRLSAAAWLAAPKSYARRLQASGPLAYWPMRETGGLTAFDLCGGSRHLTYVGVTLGQAGIGDGGSAPFFDGINDTLPVGTAMNGAFNGQLGTFALWAKVSGSGVWTDSKVRRMAYMRVDASNYFYILKDSANNRLAFRYVAGGVSKLINRDASNSTGWMHLAITFSKAADQFIAYTNGAQTGSPQTGLGTWAGASLSSAYIGSADATPADAWHGYLAHAAWWNKVLTPAEIALLATV